MEILSKIIQYVLNIMFLLLCIAFDFGQSGTYDNCIFRFQLKFSVKLECTALSKE